MKDAAVRVAVVASWRDWVVVVVLVLLVEVESSDIGGNILVPHLGLPSLSQSRALTRKEKKTFIFTLNCVI